MPTVYQPAQSAGPGAYRRRGLGAVPGGGSAGGSASAGSVARAIPSNAPTPLSASSFRRGLVRRGPVGRRVPSMVSTSARTPAGDQRIAWQRAATRAAAKRQAGDGSGSSVAAAMAVASGG